MFRLAGAAARSSDVGLARPVGWLLSAFAAWLAAAAAGAFAPIGPALLIGAVFALVDRACVPVAGERSLVRGMWAGLGDTAVVASCAILSVPIVQPGRAVLTIGVVVLAGAVVDRLAAPRTGRLRAALVMLPLLLWVGHGLAFPQARADFMREKWPQVRPALGPFFALARADVGRPVELDTGAVAWLTLPSGSPPYRPALFFHGADEDGAYQRGALFMRRALVGAGYAVLAVDERGFGASPLPPDLRDVPGWNPEPTSLAAARYLESLPEVEGSVLAVGHSMGATRALRFLNAWVGASAAVVLGATVMPPPEENARFYERFLDDFDLEDSGLPAALVLRVRNRFFNNDRAVGALDPGHAPVLFVRFTFEYENIIEGRDELFAMIPGRKVAWELRADHQFVSSRVHGVLTGDWRVMRRLQEGLRRFADGRQPSNGAPMGFSPRR